jgi:hypothetical protein
LSANGQLESLRCASSALLIADENSPAFADHLDRSTLSRLLVLAIAQILALRRVSDEEVLSKTTISSACSIHTYANALG